MKRLVKLIGVLFLITGILILTLLLAPLIPVADQWRQPHDLNLEIEPTAKGEVKGEEVEFESPLPKKIAPTPPPSPRPFVTPIVVPSNTPQPTSTPQVSPIATPEIIQEISLLAAEASLQDGVLKINFPALDLDQSWLLTIEYDLISVEDTLGFDHPGFTIHIDDRLAYQQSVVEDQVKIISFNPKVFSNHPRTLSIWSGNGGDQLKDTYAVIKNVKLIPQNRNDFIETELINDLIVTIDSADFFTLEWTSPETNDLNLNKSLTYDVRYSAELITLENWPQAQSAEVFLPHDFSPQLPKTREVVLIKSPLIESGHLAVRSLDSAGEPSPLGGNVLFNSNYY